MDWGNALSFTQGALVRIKATAMAPGLWLTSVLGVIGLGGTAIFTTLGAHTLAWVCFSLIVCLPVIAVTFVFLYFALKDPDRLQSEEFVLRNRAVNLIGIKGKGFEVNPIGFENVVDLNPPTPMKNLKETKISQQTSLPSSNTNEIENAVDIDILETEGGNDGTK
jgi:hypothetical protein